MADELKIPVIIPGTPQAVQDLGAVERSIENVGGAVKGSKPAIEEGGDALSQFGTRGGEARHAIEGMDQLMRGNFQGGILGGARVLYILREAMESTTAMVSVGLGVLGLVAAKLYEFWQEAKAEEIKASADAAKTHMEQLQKAVEETDAADLKAVTAQVKALKDEADLAIIALKALSAERLKLADAEAALKIEQIKNNPNLSEEQKVSQIAGVEQGTRDRKRTIEIEDRVQQQQAAEAAQTRAQAAAKAAEAEKAAKDAAYRTAQGAEHEAKIAPLLLAAAEAERDRIGRDIHSHGGYTRDFPSFGAAEAEVGRLKPLVEYPELLASRVAAAARAKTDKEAADKKAELAVKTLEEANKARATFNANNSPEVSATRIQIQNDEDATAAEKAKADRKKAQEEDRKKALEKQKLADEQALKDYAAGVEGGVGKLGRKHPEEADAVEHVAEAARRIGQDGATPAAGQALQDSIVKLAEASVGKDNLIAQALMKSALKVNDLTEQVRQVQQQLRDHLAN